MRSGSGSAQTSRAAFDSWPIWQSFLLPSLVVDLPLLPCGRSLFVLEASVSFACASSCAPPGAPCLTVLLLLYQIPRRPPPSSSSPLVRQWCFVLLFLPLRRLRWSPPCPALLRPRAVFLVSSVLRAPFSPGVSFADSHEACPGASRPTVFVSSGLLPPFSQLRHICRRSRSGSPLVLCSRRCRRSPCEISPSVRYFHYHLQSSRHYHPLSAPPSRLLSVARSPVRAQSESPPCPLKSAGPSLSFHGPSPCTSP